MTTSDVVVKRTVPLRVAESTATAAGPGPDHIGPIFARLIPEVLAVLARAGVRPGVAVGRHEELADDGSLDVHVGFDIADQDLADPAVAVIDLPVVTVASLLHHGPLGDLLDSYEQLAHWISDSGHTSAGPTRELYHQHSDADPAANVTELQIILGGQ